MPGGEPFDLAVQALKKMFEGSGATHEFPPDEIWSFVDEAALFPDSARNKLPNKLVLSGHLIRTGRQIAAKAQSRRGSLVARYAFGPATTGTHLGAASHT